MEIRLELTIYAEADENQIGEGSHKEIDPTR